MKHLKTFENFRINEEEEFFDKIGDFFRGGTVEEIAQKQDDFNKKFDALLKEVEDADSKRKDGSKTILKMREVGDDKYYDFDKAKMDKIAKSNNYLGKISAIWSKDSKTLFIQWKDGEKGMNKLAAGTGDQTIGA